MKSRFIQTLSILLAALLQLAPLLRQLMPSTQGLAPNAWAMILKIGVGSLALVGFDAVSRASSVSVSPANVVTGTLYTNSTAIAITYSGGHAGSVSSMQVQTNGVYQCLVGTSVPLGDGLSITYNTKNTATITGTPNKTNSLTLTIKVWDGGCGSGHSDTHSCTLLVSTNGGSASAPITPFAATPQNTCAQLGTDVQLSGGTSGSPLPTYQWWQGITPIGGATNSVLTLTNVQLSNAGTYTLTASNSSCVGQTIDGSGAGPLPQANCILSVAITGGTNYTTFNYTNFAPAGVTNVFHSYITNNFSTLTNSYSWGYNSSYKTNTPDYQKLVTPVDGGNFSVTFNVTNKVSGLSVLTLQQYDSYWIFGYLPNFTNQFPATTNVTPGGNVTLNIGIQGDLNAITSGGVNSYSTNNFPCVFWYKDGSLISSQVYTNKMYNFPFYTNSVVTASLTLNNVTSATNGNYKVVVTNYWGSITSTPVALTVGVTQTTPISQTSASGAAITYGQTLGNSSLSGSFTNAVGTSVSGTLAFALPSIIPFAGSTNVVVIFTPTDTVNYLNVTNTITVTVNKATPVLKSPNATAIAYGQKFSFSTLSGGAATNSFNAASVSGLFAFTTPNGVPDAGTTNASVTFTPGDATNYNPNTTTASVLVTNAPLVTLAVSTSTPGSVGLGGTTFPNRTYYVQMATNLGLPLPWTYILTNTSDPVTGVINFQTNTTSIPGVYYRLQFP